MYVAQLYLTSNDTNILSNIPLEGLIDFEKEKERIQKEIGRTEGFLKGVRKKLANKKFVENAPEAVVEKERQKMADAETNLEKLKAQLGEFGDG